MRVRRGKEVQDERREHEEYRRQVRKAGYASPVERLNERKDGGGNGCLWTPGLVYT